MNTIKPSVLWLTGLSGSGKSTLAKSLVTEIKNKGAMAYNLDGEFLRKTISSDLDFSRKGRATQTERVTDLCLLLLECGVIPVVSLISPYIFDRRCARDKLGDYNFVEIYMSASLEYCLSSDPKGLYHSALRNKIGNVTGISDPYEEPKQAEVTIDIEVENSQAIVVSDILELITNDSKP